MAPVFVTPSRGVQRPPTVSIVGTGRPLSEGIRLIHNKDRYGFILDKPIEGFGVAPVENTVTASARGGGSLRHRRWDTGDMFLPITLVSPNPESMYDMVARLVDVVTSQDGFFDVVFFDPYSQEARRRTVLYDSGLETVTEAIPDFKHIVGITGTFLSPFWRGPEREVVERIAPPVKPLITADPGSPVNRWDDPDFSDSTAYEPWFVVDGGLEKQGTGDDHGTYVAGHRVEVTPGETVSVSADLSYVDGPEVGNIQVKVRAYDVDGDLIDDSESTLISESYGGTYVGTYDIPDAGVEIELGFFTDPDVHANTRVRIENLDVKREIRYLATYEWEDTPHASPSINRDGDGNIVARNLVNDPSFENGIKEFSDGAIVREHSDEWSKSGKFSHKTASDRDSPGSSYIDIATSVNALGKNFDRGDWIGVQVTLYKSTDANIGHIRQVYMNGTQIESPLEAGEHTIRGAFQVPEDGNWYLRLYHYGAKDDGTVYWDDLSIVKASTESEALAQVEHYFDGDTPDELDQGRLEGAYSFPFFPVLLADSTVQGEHELRVEGDAPVWPIWEIMGPGRDVEIIGPDGSRLFVEGEVSSSIRIVTEPGKRSITDDTGLIWERMKPGDDQFFALQPGEQVIKMTMVGGTPESTIKAVYSENWKTPRGTANTLVGGGVDTE